MACCRTFVVLLSVLASMLRTGSTTPVQLYKNDYREENLLPVTNTLEEDELGELQASPLKPSNEQMYSGREKFKGTEKIVDKHEQQAVSSIGDEAPREMNIPLRPEREGFSNQEAPMNVVSLLDYVVRRVQDEMVDSFCGLTQCSEPCGSRGKLDVEKCLRCIAPSFQDMKPVSVYHE